MSAQNNKIEQDKYLEPSVDYATLMKEIRNRQFTRNDIKSFVYKVFVMYERATCENEHVNVDEFKPFIDENIYVDFPDYQIRSWNDYVEWHQWIHNLLESDDHDIEKINVEFLVNGKYQVAFDVRWRGLFKDGTYLDNTIRQVWIMREEEGKQLPVIEKYIAKVNDPMVIAN
ncbi:hypothetical protein [Marinifilum breve]|uniref:hypothetical protein n=1 Tax=Marinifilum breve TaxID=2184082 RepID=UPI001A9C4AFB|nr:hypothetical protein [Marinifilum breve]